LGIAQLTKFSLLIFYPLIFLFLIIWEIIKLIRQNRNHESSPVIKQLLKTIGNLFAVFAISIIVIYLVYLPQNINYPQENKQVIQNKFLILLLAVRIKN